MNPLYTSNHSDKENEAQENVGRGRATEADNPPRQSGKRTRLMSKKQTKFERNIDRCIDFIVESDFENASNTLRDLINQGFFLDKYPLVGWGGDEDVDLIFPGEPRRWLAQIVQPREKVRNPFDLLGICHMIKSYHSPSDQDFDQALNCYFSLKGEFKFEINVSLGNLLYNRGCEEDAILEFEEALEDRPLEKIYQKLGMLMLKASNRQNSLLYVQKCLQMNENNCRALLLKQKLKKSKAEKKEILKKIIGVSPRFTEPYLCLVSLSEDFNQKVALLDKVISIHPNRAFLTCEKVDLLMSRGRQYSYQCRKILREFLSSYGEDWRVYEHLGDVEQALNNKKEFIENYEKSFEIFAGNEDVAEALAEYYSNSNPSRVIEICLKFKKENELSLSLFQKLAQSYQQTGETDKALRCYEQLLDIYEDYFPAMMELARLYKKEENFKGACSLFRRAHDLQIDEHVGNSCYQLSYCYFKLYLLDDAQSWAYQCLQNEGDENDEIYNLMGSIFLEKGDFQQSLSWYLKWVLITGNLESDQIETRVVPKLGAAETVSLIISGVREEDIEITPVVLCYVAQLFMRLGFFDEAEEFFQKARNQHLEVYENNYEFLEELVKHFGDSSRGIVSFKDSVHLDKLKQQFFSTFRKFYEQQT